MHYVTNANYIEDHKIWLEFNDKKQGIVDLSTVICNDHRPIFRELSNTNQFRKFRVEADTIVWENGLDLSPEFLYNKLDTVSNISTTHI